MSIRSCSLFSTLPHTTAYRYNEKQNIKSKTISKEEQYQKLIKFFFKRNNARIIILFKGKIKVNFKKKERDEVKQIYLYLFFFKFDHLFTL
jgi:hypothetical protein